ncbi:MAG TPA: L,D-transpeptidase family protein [Gammaproteobacteria bacterium]|nr:L,D-transpeptidase family protein [Gammaproteobacteria bacterium]
MFLPAIFLLLLPTPAAQMPMPVDQAERLTVTILDAATRQQWDLTQPALRSLREQYPEFRPLPQLETLVQRHGMITLTPPVAITPETDEFLPDNLQAELLLRWQHRAPAKGLYPYPLLKLGAHHPYIFVVDLEKARLYLYENAGGELRLLANYYSGIGKQGAGKRREGDHRTPVGVYTFLEYIGDNRLPDLYGAGALTLNYPNRWDRRLGRTGSNIWLHGVPRSTYSRAPRSSRGCVTVSNFIFDALSRYALPGHTPIVLADHLEWQTAEQTAQQRTVFDALLEQWRVAQAASAAAEIDLEDIDMYFYPGEQNLVQMNFKQLTAPAGSAKESFRTLYWKLQPDNLWKVVAEF